MEGSKHIPQNVLVQLKTVTGLADPIAWSNAMSLTGKAEQNSLKWWENDKGGDVYSWSTYLSYDWNRGPKRGVTIGIAGFTTHHNGKPEGDAQDLFKEYKRLGGEDLAPMSKECAKDEDACKKLIAKIKTLKGDSKWILAQWNRLLQPTGYIYESMQLLKKHKITNPKMLTLAALIDCSINQGYDGKHGCGDIVEKAGHEGNEAAFLQKFLEIRKPIAGTGAYNDPPSNGHNRVQQYIDLLKAKSWDLTDDALITKVTSWTMK